MTGDQPAGFDGRIDLASVFTTVAHAVEPEADVDRTVQHIVDAVSATVPTAEHVGVSLLESGQIRSVAPSSPLVAELHALQREIGDGPCVDAAFTSNSYRTGDLALDSRWPRFARAAADRGISSLLALRLFTSNNVLGALNLYSSRPQAFDAETEHLVQLFAAHAAVALVGANRQAELRTALSTRDVIGMAKGILMQRHHIDADKAFSLLVEASQHANMKLREVAQWLVDGHE
jgi:GAF domain-containing protein